MGWKLLAGRGACSDWRAWTLVFSSVQTTQIPCGTARQWPAHTNGAPDEHAGEILRASGCAASYGSAKGGSSRLLASVRQSLLRELEALGWQRRGRASSPRLQ